MGERVDSFNSFRFVGRVKHKEEFHRVFEGDNFTIESVSFSIDCGNNRHYLECSGFKPKDGNKEITYFLKDGTRLKTTFNNRINENTEDLSHMHSVIKNISPNGDEEVVRFISDYDFVRYLKGMIETNKFDGKTFEISGGIEYSEYNDKDTGKPIETVRYRPKKIVHVNDDATEISTGRYNLYLGDDSFVKIGDVGIINGLALCEVYNKKIKESEIKGYKVNVEVNLGTDTDLGYEIFSKRYKGSNDRLHRIGLECEIINGSEDVEFTEDMLTDDERALIGIGADSFENIKKSKGSGVGEFKRMIKRTRDLRGYSEGAIDTALTVNDIVNLRNQVVESIDEVLDETPVKEEKLEVDDMFDDIFA